MSTFVSMSTFISIENLSFAYGDKRVLDNINLTVERGENVGIAGASGGGKSSLIKVIAGLYEIYGGCIAIDGEQSPSRRRKLTAVVLQNAVLFPSSIRENITCGHTMPDTVIERACEAAQLMDWISSLPGGLDTYIGERGGRVSGGQAQRIAIARAIAKDAPAILLDEPTSALDIETGAALMAAIAALAKGKTVLHVSHQTDMLKGCDRILRLEGGRLIDIRS